MECGTESIRGGTKFVLKAQCAFKTDGKIFFLITQHQLNRQLFVKFVKRNSFGVNNRIMPATTGRKKKVYTCLTKVYTCIKVYTCYTCVLYMFPLFRAYVRILTELKQDYILDWCHSKTKYIRST